MYEIIDEAIKKYFHLYSEDNYSIKAINEGLSGADVFFLKINVSRRTKEVGNYILKVIDTKNEWYRAESNEVVKSRMIYEESPDFRTHLVKLLYQETINDKLIIISSYALKTKLNSLSLDQSQIDIKCNLMSQIAIGLLDQFNADCIEYHKGTVVKELCRYRLEKGANFETRIRNLLLDADMPGINIRGEILPNPLYYLQTACEHIEQMGVHFLWGKVHGDLHQKNILVLNQSKSDQINDYVVIDYDSYERNFLLFDHAYLELNIYDFELADADLFTWKRAMETVTDLELEDTYTGIEFGQIGRIRDQLIAGLLAWARKSMPENSDLLRIQLTLARISAGINFLSKGKIENEVVQIRYLIYTALNLRKLLGYLSIDWDREDTSRLKKINVDEDLAAQIWDACGGLRSEYLKILITDDDYTDTLYQEVRDIGTVKWDIILDVGKNKTGSDMYEAVGSQIKAHRNLYYQQKVPEPGEKTPVRGTCIWLNGKQEENEMEIMHRIRIMKLISPYFEYLCSKHSFKSLLFVFDCHKNTVMVDGIINMLLDKNMMRSDMRILCLGRNMGADYAAVFSNMKIEHFYYERASLLDFVHMLRIYGPTMRKTDGRILIPALGCNRIEIMESEYKYYSSSVELVYSGLEDKVEDYSNGVDFYKGNEISWLDLELEKDIRLTNHKKYLELLLEKLEKAKTPVCRLGHGAGGGGTTLSRRLMWDIKDRHPVVRIHTYSRETANIICELYRKTSLPVFVVMEMGSTIISEDELNSLVVEVNAQSCRALFLKVERLVNEDKEKNVDILVKEQLDSMEAKRFQTKYSELTFDERRLQNLKNITEKRYDSEWQSQCCPFFYGFYTFQEEFMALPAFIRLTIRNCGENVKAILADMSLITKYSQVMCIPYEEMVRRLQCDSYSLVEIYRRLGESVRKIVTCREEGFRICHPLIADKILEEIYDKKYLYNATMDFIQRMDGMYHDTGREYLDGIFRELLIDRSYIDGEQQKFSMLITELKFADKKKAVFEKLIELYPDNPHYYNHLGRSEVADDNEYKNYESAIHYLNKAISTAAEGNLSVVSHYITIACIYSKKITAEINDRRYSDISMHKLLDIIMTDFSTASDYFERARRIQNDSSYGYFPNILMICNVIREITKVMCSTVDKLVMDHPEFSMWYNEYAGMAVQLYAEMERNCDEGDIMQLKEAAQGRIAYLQGNVEALKKRLLSLEKKGQDKDSRNLRRTISYLIYSQNSFSWRGMEKSDIAYIEKEMYENVTNGDATQRDVMTWLSAYRESPEFDAARAIGILSDYMEDSYNKAYLLWWLFFLEYERGMVGERQVTEHLKRCKFSNDLALSTVRTSRYIDAYTDAQSGCPIKNLNHLEKDEDGRFLHLKVFTGKITKINGTTSGTIIMDGTNLEVFLTPSFSDGENKREFSSKDETKRVEFNLMFTYSGLRAWDPRII